MTFKEFENVVLDYCKNNLSSDFTVRVSDVRKNNGIVLKGISAIKDGRNAAPTIYLNELYSRLLSGTDLEEILNECVRIIDNPDFGPIEELDFMSDYEKAKDRVYYKLINTEKNRDTLENVPHLNFLDLSIVFYIVVSCGSGDTGTILINNQILNGFCVTLDRLFEDAKLNTIKKLKSVIKPIEEILTDLHANLEEEEDLSYCTDIDGNSFMYVLTNSRKLNGAACILDKEMLMNFAESKQSDFYIIPSSIHEVILVPSRDEISREALREMIHQVNSTEVEPMEVLSDSLYMFKRNAGRVVCV